MGGPVRDGGIFFYKLKTMKKKTDYYDGMFLNYYKCPACGYRWADVWSCMVDDACLCGQRNISPHTSIDLPDPKYKPRWVVLIYIYLDVQHDVYLFDYNNRESANVRKRFEEILMNSGWRAMREKETLMQYWGHYLREFQQVLVETWDDDYNERLRKRGCDPDRFNGQDEYYKFEDSLEVL